MKSNYCCSRIKALADWNSSLGHSPNVRLLRSFDCGGLLVGIHKNRCNYVNCLKSNDNLRHAEMISWGNSKSKNVKAILSKEFSLNCQLRLSRHHRSADFWWESPAHTCREVFPEAATGRASQTPTQSSCESKAKYKSCHANTFAMPVASTSKFKGDTS